MGEGGRKDKKTAVTCDLRFIISGCSAVRLARTVRVREVGGSNPPTPTFFITVRSVGGYPEGYGSQSPYGGGSQSPSRIPLRFTNPPTPTFFFITVRSVGGYPYGGGSQSPSRILQTLIRALRNPIIQKIFLKRGDLIAVL